MKGKKVVIIIVVVIMAIELFWDSFFAVPRFLRELFSYDREALEEASRTNY